MASLKGLVCILGLLVAVLVNACEATSKINAARLLLPYATAVPTNYTLEVEDGGCYKWSSTRPDVASVAPILEEGSTETGCSSRAVVNAVSRTPQRLSAIIFATEVGSGNMLRTDVNVDKIKSIEIVTTTREIVLDGVPEIFKVSAKNEQDDTFTCLDGIEFEWKAEAITSDVGDTNNLR